MNRTSFVTANLSRPKLTWIIFKNSVFTAKKTELFSITKIKWLITFKETITVYSENQKKLINALHGQNAELLIVKYGGTCTCSWVLKH
jgi:uracil DNA glycosylase